MHSSSTDDKPWQWPDDDEKLSHVGGDAQGRPKNTDDELDALFATGESPKHQSPKASRLDPWPADSHTDTLPGGTSRGFMDPIGQFVYQEHNTFFRTRMPKSNHWSVGWSNLMMTMFIFFVVLFVFFSLRPRDSAKIGSAGGSGMDQQTMPAEAATEQFFALSKKAIVDQKLGDFVHVDRAPDKPVRIVLTGDLLFDPGQAELKSQARQLLPGIADLLRSTPYMINVVGHTDDTPIHTALFPSNWELSMARAGVVAHYLIDEMGLPANRFYVTGRASYQPELPNNSPANRAVNRRVEIIITRDLPKAKLDAQPK